MLINNNTLKFDFLNLKNIAGALVKPSLVMLFISTSTNRLDFIMENYLHYNFEYPERFGPFLERWLPVIEFEEQYKISDYGRVISSKNGLLKLNREQQSYVGITLTSNGVKRRVDVHILVCEHFLPNPENKACVNHKLGFKDQNFIGELEWITYVENSLHSFDVLKRYTNPNNHMKKSFYVTFNSNTIKAFGIRRTARMLNMPYQAIQNILKGNGNTYNGFTFTNIT